MCDCRGGLLLLEFSSLLFLCDLELFLEVLEYPLAATVLLKHLIHTGLIPHDNVVVSMYEFFPQKVLPRVGHHEVIGQIVFSEVPDQVPVHILVVLSDYFWGQLLSVAIGFI